MSAHLLTRSNRTILARHTMQTHYWEIHTHGLVWMKNNGFLIFNTFMSKRGKQVLFQVLLFLLSKLWRVIFLKKQEKVWDMYSLTFLGQL